MWADSIGGDLPNRFDSALLFATLKDQFDAAWYWTRDEHILGSEFAWGQDFSIGGQYYEHKSRNLSARAVRRLNIGD